MPALLGLYGKHYLLTKGGGYRIAARSLGRIEYTKIATLGLRDPKLAPLEKLTFFRGDILIMLIGIPLILFVVARYLPQRWRAPFVAVWSAAAFLIIGIQFRAISAVGRFLSYEMLRRAVHWGWGQPEDIRVYLNPPKLLAIAAVVAVVGVVARLLWRRIRNRRSQRDISSNTPRPLSRILASAILAIVLLAAVLSLVSRIPATPLHESFLVSSLRSFWEEDEDNTKEFAGLTPTALISQYRELVHAPAYRRNSRYWASSSGSNVLFFVLETAPAHYLPADDELNDLPNLRRLREHSLVAAQHYSTYSLTHQALFSMLTSWYPTNRMTHLIERHPGMLVPGLPRMLASAGYRTAAYYGGHWMWASDRAMLESVGISEQHSPSEEVKLPPGYEYPGQPDWMKTRLALDLGALNLMKRDLEQWLSEGRRFSVLFLPQVGHYPCPEVRKTNVSAEPQERARAALVLQDAWLGEIIALLERHHQLEQTVILVTGDHGIRTREEDPRLPGGLIDEFSFHVPFLIFAPKTFAHTESIPWLTSHVDVAPTLLDLLGMDSGRQSEQGTPMWDPEIARRTTYLLASQMFGADGYYSGGHFFMWNRILSSVYENSEPHFDGTRLVPSEAGSASDVPRSIVRLNGLQEVWAVKFSLPAPTREPAKSQ